MKHFTSQDINWWTGVVWIIVMFLSAAWTAPIHSIGEQAKFLKICSYKD